MLSAEAYSFQLKSRLAISLSWVAGYTNVVTLATTTHVISHVTGNVTMFGHSIGNGRLADVWFFGFLIGMFFAGAVLSAILTETGRRSGLRSKYVLPIAVEALLLSLFAFGIDHTAAARLAPGDLRNQYFLCGMATAAMGIQNATITRISGAIVRTTHLTGVVTDIGLEGVQFALWYWDQFRSRHKSRLSRTLRVTRRHPSFLRLLLLVSIVGSFIFGATAGTLIYAYRPSVAMVLPVAFLAWMIVEGWRRPIADVKELDLVSDPELRMHGILKSLLPPEMGIYRIAFHTSSHHRAPNFAQWAERVPREWRVVILAVSPLIHFDHESALNLRAAAERLRKHRCQLVLAGITQGQFRALFDAGVMEVVEEHNLCTDLEFAIARGIGLLQSMRGQGSRAGVATA